MAALRDPKLVALTLAKSSLADERDVSLRIAAESRVDADITDVMPVLTVTGNLIDNAIEATAAVAGSLGGSDHRVRRRQPADPGP